jgi:RNA polymerase sigma-70 factor (ECF subfamily)
MSNNIQSLAFEFIENKNNKNFKLLTQRLNPGLSSFAFKFVKDKDLAKEVVEQTFIAVWEKIGQYNPQYNFSTWVYAIAKNEALGILRVKNKTLSYEKYTANHSKLLQSCTPTYSLETECMGPTGEEVTRILYDASLSAIHELEEPYKTVMIEREINQKQLNDIANDLQMNLSTVKTRLRKGRKDIAEILYKKYPDLVDSYFGNENEE